MVGWVMAYVSVAGVVALGSAADISALVFPALVALAFAAWGFLRQGGRLITASAVYCYCSGVFLAFPALFAAIAADGRTMSIGFGWLLLGLSLGVLAQAAVMVICPLGPVSVIPWRPNAGEPTHLRAVVILAVLAMVALQVPKLETAAVPQALGALMIFALARGWCVAMTPLARTGYLIGMITASVGYYLVLFEGFGRLVLGSIACGAAAMIAIHHRGHGPKLAVLIGTAPAVGLLALQRLTFLQSVRGVRADASEGIGSVTGPFVSYCRILQAYVDGEIRPSWGSTFWAAAVSWVPRAWWPSKPVGFGVEMIPITQPTRVGVVGFSDAATILGELIWNWGTAAILAMAVIGVLLRRLDAAMVRLAEDTGSGGTTHQLRELAVVAVTAGVVNLFWGGAFTFASRLLPTVAVLVAWALVRSLARRRPLQSIASRPARRRPPENNGECATACAPLSSRHDICSDGVVVGEIVTPCGAVGGGAFGACANPPPDGARRTTPETHQPNSAVRAGG